MTTEQALEIIEKALEVISATKQQHRLITEAFETIKKEISPLTGGQTDEGQAL